MTQPSSKRFVMEDGYLANKVATDAAIAAEIIDRQDGDDDTLSFANFYTDTEIASLNSELGGRRPLPNYLINGAFDIWQRGTSATFATGGGVGSAGYIADRWRTYATGTPGGAYTFSRIEETSRQPGTMARYAMQISQNNTLIDGNHFGIVQQVIETSDLFPIIGREIAFSVYLESTINTVVEIQLIKDSVTDSSSPVPVPFGDITYANVVAGVVNRFSVSTFGMSWDDLTVGVQIKTNLQNIGDSIIVSRAKLEPTSISGTITDFVRNSPNVATELASCQRYYYRANGLAVGQPLGFGNSTAATTATAFVPFPVTMRKAPTSLERTAVAANYAVTNGAGTLVACSVIPSHTSASTSGARVGLTVAAGLTAGQGTMLLANATTTYLGWNAEIL